MIQVERSFGRVGACAGGVAGEIEVETVRVSIFELAVTEGQDAVDRRLRYRRQLPVVRDVRAGRCRNCLRRQRAAERCPPSRGRTCGL